MEKIYYFCLRKSIGMYINFLSYINSQKATQSAHILFSNPRKGKFSEENLPKTLKEAHLESIQYNGDVIQTYIWKGNETIILLIHGWESNSSRWKKMLPYLKKSGSSIVAIDGPAQGLSSGKEMTAIKYAEFVNIVCQKHQPTYLIGHSMGGMTSLYYQYKYQNPTVQKMVLLGTPCEIQIIFQNFIDLLSLNSKIYYGLKTKYEQFFDIQLEQFNAVNFVKSISARGLIVHDIEDQIVLFEEGKKIATAWKGSQFIETEGLGHKLHDEDLYRKVAQFLFETE